MNRGNWNRFMIVLMGAVIVFGLQEIFRSPEPLNESRYLLSIGIAVLVIILKIGEIRKADSETRKPSQV
jgi:ABC-type branched-subunit amino acid transport system permease subunit